MCFPYLKALFIPSIVLSTGYSDRVTLFPATPVRAARSTALTANCPSPLWKLILQIPLVLLTGSSVQPHSSARSNSSILFTTYFTVPVCPSSLYKLWHVGAAPWSSKELTDCVKGRNSLVQHFGKAGHAADGVKVLKMILLDMLVGKPAAFYS